MSKKGSSASARLLDEYIAAVKQGKAPSVDEVLAPCPMADREDLRLALIGVQSLLEYHWMTYVSPETVDDTLAEMKRIRERKQRLQQANERLGALPDHISGDPIPLLLTTLEFPPDLLQSAIAARRAPTAATPWFRGQAALTPRTRRILDRENQTLLEQRMAEQATTLLDRYGLCNAPVDLEALARRLGLAVRAAALDENLDGCLLADDHFGAILLNRRIANHQRRRFTLAHEIAHFILHRRWRVFRDQWVEMGITSDDGEEVEADTLAAMLLMPPDRFPRSYASQRPSLKAADEIAGTFDVSLQAALRRLVRASDWGCALVFIESGRVKRWVESNYFDGFVPVGRSVHPATAAARLAAPDADAGEISPVEDATALPLSAWVDVTEEDPDRMLREESRQLAGKYIYSLITLTE